jgi:hypothetical protein
MVAECLPGDDAGPDWPEVGVPPACGGEAGNPAEPGAPDQRAENGWGKMEPHNRGWDGEGRLSR